MKTIVLLLFVASILTFAGTPESIGNFSLNDYNGKNVSLTDFKSSKAVVLMFISTQCPVSNAYNERMAALYNDYNSKQITLLGINSNKAESPEDIKEHAQEHNFGFPILKDVKNVIADKLDANHTPEIFVLDPASLKIVYHGRIDDAQREAKVTSQDLRKTLDEILAGKSVSVKETKAFGCSIKREK